MSTYLIFCEFVFSSKSIDGPYVAIKRGLDVEELTGSPPPYMRTLVRLSHVPRTH